MTTAEIIELTGKYVMRTYGRLPLALVRGQGARVWDAEGKEYLDFVAGLAVCSLGHCHPAVVEAIASQARKLMHVSNLYHIEPQAKLAQLLVENSCGDRVFFCNSGAEANEAAIKLARKYGKIHGGQDKYEIITALKSFHGRTLAAITATAQPKYQKGFEPLPAGFKYVPFNDVEALQQVVNPNTCAVLLEPVQGEGGVNVATSEYLKAARELCDRYNALLIFDEVQCGLGRTGKFLAYQHYGVEPDIFTLAKALGGGFPIGAMVAKEKVAVAFSPGDHASTFGGNPLACAAALAAMRCLLREGVIENAARVGAYFKERLLELAGRFPFIQEVRGLGLILGMELTIEGRDIVGKCQDRGLLINCVDNHILRFIPPLVITRAEVDEAVEILAGVLAEMKQ
ncbi:putative acetylornithine/succinylornithine family transaminase [Desulfofundulus luciae]|uniref:Acetylornithine aminotransferase n=1 Tax=Desulfofundulus luciae TaxID=74702 RepID=A0ABU0AZJ5_9FIRM|nr:acetylornithine transaminase [Desulfofundulus luciae]MDQ0285444.1 putative acetylornithine/succinylornithine family transaminase [Desulfofundulus luciae]